jgi:hypothetical protein
MPMQSSYHKPQTQTQTYKLELKLVRKDFPKLGMAKR